MNFARIRQFAIRYERHLSVVSMAIGFLLDNIGLKRIDLLSSALLLYFYMISSAVFILLIHLFDVGRWKGRVAQAVRPWLPFALQVVLGSWFSAFIVFYSHGSSFSASWLLLLIVFALFAGTEIFHQYHDRLVFQNLLYFFAIFSLMVSVVPLYVGAIGTGVFLLSGAVSLLAYGIFLALLYVTGPQRFAADARRIIRGVVVVYALLNLLYFTHYLPPLPLALEDIGVYHSLAHGVNGYVVTGESTNIVTDIFGGQTVHIQQGGSITVFSSVFTPVAIRTNLIHRWERYDEVTHTWTQASTVSFPVSGGRDGGYRGYSTIDGISEGSWRVSVETPNGGLIGRIPFTVQYVSQEPALQQSVL